MFDGSKIDEMVTLGRINTATGSYYYKKALDGFIATEMIASELAKLVGIKTGDYETFTWNGMNYYLSKDLNEQGPFFTFAELGVCADSLNEYWYVLDKYYGKYSEYLMRDIVKVYLFDILFLQSDRNPDNLGLINTPIPQIVMIDNEFMFDNMPVVLSSKYSCADYLNYYKCSQWVIEPFLRENMEELEYFLAISSDEFINLFWEMYERVNPKVVKNVISKYADNETIKLYLARYKKNYELIGRLKGRDSSGQRILKNK